MAADKVKCTCCGRPLSPDNFWKSKDKRNGLRSWCKDCVKWQSKMKKRSEAPREKKVRNTFPRIGSKHHKAKLTESDIPLIRELIAAGLTQKAVGEKFEVSKNTISAIVNGRNWTHA